MRYILLYGIWLTLASCGGATHHISSGNLGNNKTYNQDSYYGCCGCKAKYVNIMSGKRIAEQIIYSFNCPAKGLTTKFIFNLKGNGKITSCEKYIATTKDDYTIAVSGDEKKVFEILDKESASSSFSAIKGFRKALGNEWSHEFPLVKKGSKVLIK